MNNLGTLQALIDTLPRYGDRTAVLALRRGDVAEWSFAVLADHVQRQAAGLAEAGVARGDHVALLADNRPEWIAACLAVLAAGGVVVPLDVNMDETDLGHALRDSGVRRILTTTAQVERIARFDAALMPTLLDVGEEDERSWRCLLAERAGALPHVAADDPAALFYTSGTTGTPKGVPLTHGNLVFPLNTLVSMDLVVADDRVLLPLPLHHVYAFVIGMLLPLALGLPIIFPSALTGPQLVRALQVGEATVLLGVPRLYDALYRGIVARIASRGRAAVPLFAAGVGLSAWLRRRLRLPLGARLLAPVRRQVGPHLRLLASGGAPLDPALAWRLEGLGWQVAIGYGLTETAALLTLNPPGATKLDSVGRPPPGVALRIAPSALPGAEPRQDRAPRADGEILARGPGVFAGYHHLPDQTVLAFTDDDWFRTGDLGHVDDAGDYYVTGRASTLIVTQGGENIQPEDVEEAYQACPAIREIGVLQREGRLVALIVPEPGAIGARAADSGPAIRAGLQERSPQLPSYWRLSDYAITPTPLPRTELGKIRRHLLAVRYEQARSGAEARGPAAVGPLAPAEMSAPDRALLEDPAARQVWDWLAGRYPDRHLTPDTSPQLDLGVDSLAWITLTLEIRQRAGVELDEEAIGRITTVRDLLREVATAAPVAGRAAPLDQPEEVLSARQKRWLAPRGPALAALARALYGLDRSVMRRLFHLRVQGREQLPEHGPLVLTPNHTSYLDPLALAAALDDRRLQQTYWAGWTGVAFGNPLARLASRIVQAVPVDPQRGTVSSLAFGAAVLKREKILIWFPEGTRSWSGELQPFKPGIGLLLQHIPAPVVPVFIHGTHAALPRGQAVVRPGRITVVFGRPLDVRDLAQQGAGEQPDERIARALHDRVAGLDGQA